MSYSLSTADLTSLLRDAGAFPHSYGNYERVSFYEGAPRGLFAEPRAVPVYFTPSEQLSYEHPTQHNVPICTILLDDAKEAVKAATKARLPLSVDKEGLYLGGVRKADATDNSYDYQLREGLPLSYPMVEAMRAAAACVSTDQTRIALNAVALERYDIDNWAVVATDGHRLHLEQAGKEFGVDWKTYLVPPPVLKVLSKITPDTPSALLIDEHGEAVGLATQSLHLLCAPTPGPYLKWRNVIPTVEGSTRGLSAHKGELIAAIGQAVAQGSSSGELVCFDDSCEAWGGNKGKRVKIAGAAWRGEAPFRIGFGADYLLEMLTHRVRSARVELCFTSAVGAMTIREGNRLHLLMPRRLSEED